ncbi:NADP-dependent oxidoreductase [Streptomyces sp. NPDC056987]|uniref:NADP-dependent oxidoreductase n=1 Tax=Streptomyces sp. NPDC056987 TaxID=3345988 RepID=UPI003640ADB3
MKAISYRRHGGPGVLEYGDRPEPKVGPDSVLVEVRAAAVNPVDWKCREGYLDGVLDTVFPVIPGWDVAGVVLRPGAAVTEFAAGDEVIGYVREDFLSRGTFAQYVAAPVRTLAHKPRSLGFPEAAGLPLAGLTAHQVLHRVLRVRPGETVLVHAAAGAVGSLAVQLARHHGARVIGAARASGQEHIRALGGEAVTYGDDLGAQVRALAPDGVDAALDSIGGDILRMTPGLLAPGGRLASIADSAVGELGGSYGFARADTADLTELAGLAEQGALTVGVARTYPLEQTADAFQFAEAGGAGGKVVVTMG